MPDGERSPPGDQAPIEFNRRFVSQLVTGSERMCYAVGQPSPTPSAPDSCCDSKRVSGPSGPGNRTPDTEHRTPDTEHMGCIRRRLRDVVGLLLVVSRSLRRLPPERSGRYPASETRHLFGPVCSGAPPLPGIFRRSQAKRFLGVKVSPATQKCLLVSRPSTEQATGCFRMQGCTQLPSRASCARM